MSEEDRGELMARRLGRALERAGLDPKDAGGIVVAFRHSLETRRARLSDDHHPDRLHPGRTVLILLEDLGVTDPVVLTAGALCETLRSELAPEGGRAVGPPEVTALLDRVPRPDQAGDALLEQLVAADEPARLLALAERLDHARHLHLRDAAEWEPLHRQTCEAYLPVAERTHPTLARRYRWWCRMFAERYLGRV